MKEYNVDARLKKLARPGGWAFALIAIGLVMLLFKDWSRMHGVFQILDALLFPVIGVALFVDSSRRMQKIRGSYLKLGPDSFSFKSRGVEQMFDTLDEIKDIQITLETVKILDASDTTSTLFLEDYMGDGERNEIKAYFEELQTKMNR